MLAFNLANVLLLDNRAAEALEPARRAFAIAAARGPQASGVSPVVARLFVERAALASGEAGAVERLNAALDAAIAAQADPQDIYQAAIELGEGLLSQERYETAQSPLAVAIQNVPAEGSAGDSARFRAHLALGRALMMSSRIEGVLSDVPLLGTRIRVQPDTRPEEGALAHFNAAIDLARPYAGMLAEDRSLTRAQQDLARAMAWRGVLRARMVSLRIPIAEDDRGGVSWARGGAICDMELVAVPAPRYPREALSRYRVGAAVVYLVTNAQGEATNVSVAAAVGGPAFVEAVNTVAAEWHMRLRGTPSEDCSMEIVTLRPIVFVIQ